MEPSGKGQGYIILSQGGSDDEVGMLMQSTTLESSFPRPPFCCTAGWLWLHPAEGPASVGQLSVTPALSLGSDSHSDLCYFRFSNGEGSSLCGLRGGSPALTGFSLSTPSVPLQTVTSLESRLPHLMCTGFLKGFRPICHCRHPPPEPFRFSAPCFLFSLLYHVTLLFVVVRLFP